MLVDASICVNCEDGNVEDGNCEDGNPPACMSELSERIKEHLKTSDV